MAWKDERATDEHVPFWNAERASTILLEAADGHQPLSLGDTVSKSKHSVWEACEPEAILYYQPRNKKSFCISKELLRAHSSVSGSYLHIVYISNSFYF